MTKPRPVADPRLAERFRKAGLKATSDLTAKNHQKLLADLQIYLDNLGSSFIKFLQMKLSERIVHNTKSSNMSALRSGNNPNATGKQLEYGRSKRGQYPAQESGSLKASVHWKVDKTGTKPTLTVGILKDVRKKNPRTGRMQTKSPRLYGQELEWRLGRRLIHAAWKEFSPHAFNKGFRFKVPGQRIDMTFKVVRVQSGAYGEHEIVTIPDYERMLKKELDAAQKWRDLYRQRGSGTLPSMLKRVKGMGDSLAYQPQMAETEYDDETGEVSYSAEPVSERTLMQREKIIRAYRNKFR